MNSKHRPRSGQQARTDRAVGEKRLTLGGMSQKNEVISIKIHGPEAKLIRKNTDCYKKKGLQKKIPVPDPQSTRRKGKKSSRWRTGGPPHARGKEWGKKKATGGSSPESAWVWWLKLKATPKKKNTQLRGKKNIEGRLKKISKGIASEPITPLR